MPTLARSRSLVVALAVVTIAPLAGAVWIQAGKKAPPIKPQMNVLRDGTKTLAKDLADPKRQDEALETVMKMQDAVQLAKQGEPAATGKQEKDAKAGFVAEYRASMIALQQDLLALEAAIVAGDTQKAQDLAQKVGAAKGPGHDKFNPKR